MYVAILLLHVEIFRLDAAIRAVQVEAFTIKADQIRVACPYLIFTFASASRRFLASAASGLFG